MRLVNVAATVLRANLSGGSRPRVPGVKGGLAVYGRVGQPCRRCGDTVASRRTAEHARVLYWCPGCQLRFDPRRSRLDDTQWLDEPKTDRHPAARKFLADGPWRRTG